MITDLEFYNTLLEDIIARSSGDYRNMSLTDRITTIGIMRQIKEIFDVMIRDYYPQVCDWASLNVTDEILKVKEPDDRSLEQLFNLKDYRFDLKYSKNY